MIPEKIKEIKSLTFCGCSTLSDITFSIGISLIADQAFQSTAFTSMTIPSTVKELGNSAFSNCGSLVSLTVEDSAEPLKCGVDVFTKTPVTSVTLGRVLNCGSGAKGVFEEHVELKTLKITGKCTSLSAAIFKGCTALVNVSVEEGLREIGQDAFASCEALQTLQLPQSVAAIHANAFSRCYNLASFNLPEKVSVIEMSTFYMCRNLPTLDLANIKEIQNQAFYGCDVINNIKLSDKLITIGNDAFSDCMALSAIIIPGNVTTMGDGVFFNCPKLTSVTFESGGNLLRMGDKQFVDCPVREFILGRNIEYTGSSDENIFGSNTTLYEVSIMTSVNRICDNMFDGCQRLTEIVLPGSITKIGYNAFGNCPGLTAVTSKNYTPPTASGAFSQTVCNNATLTVPFSAQSSYKSAAGWKDFKRFKTLPDVPKYKVNVSSSGPGVVYVNGSDSKSIEVPSGEPLTIVATPNKDKAVISASYTIGGTRHTFLSTVTIPAVTGDVSVSVEFGDVPKELPTAISITPAKVTIAPAATAQLFVDYEPYDSYAPITWSVISGSNSVRVSNDGIVTGVENGVAVICASTSNGLKATATVTVSDGTMRIEEIPYLEAGQKWQAKLLENGEAITSGVSWSSSNPSEVSITSEGIITIRVQSYDFVSAIIIAKYNGTECVYDFTTLPSNVYSFTGSDGLNYSFEHSLDGVSVSTSKYTGSSSEIVIESSVKDEFGCEYPVIGIYDLTLDSQVTSLVLPESMRYIDRIDARWLDTLTCKATSVPQTETLNLLDEYGDKTIIYVPASALNVYKNNPIWNWYILRPIENVSVEKIEGERDEISLNGLQINAKGRIEVYNLSGIKVASGEDELTLPAKGLYIVKVGERCVKVHAF